MAEELQHNGGAEWLTQENIARVNGLIQQYLDAPTYKDVGLDKAAWKYENFPTTRTVLDELEAQAKPLRLETKEYSKCLELYAHALEEIVPSLPQEEQKVAKREIMYLLGYYHESRGTFEMKDRPLSDPERKAHYLQAVEWYIRADLENAECVTEIALSAAEASAAAEMQEVFGLILDKIWPGPKTIINKSDKPAMEALNDLINGASNVEGRDGVTFMTGELPPVDLN